MKTTRPRPDADLLERRSVDRHDDDLAARLALQPVEAQIGEHVSEGVMPARRQHYGQRDYHEDMRSVVLQLIPLARRRSGRRALPLEPDHCRRSVSPTEKASDQAKRSTDDPVDHASSSPHGPIDDAVHACNDAARHVANDGNRVADHAATGRSPTASGGRSAATTIATTIAATAAAIAAASRSAETAAVHGCHRAGARFGASAPDSVVSGRIS